MVVFHVFVQFCDTNFGRLPIKWWLDRSILSLCTRRTILKLNRLFLISFLMHFDRLPWFSGNLQTNKATLDCINMGTAVALSWHPAVTAWTTAERLRFNNDTHSVWINRTAVMPALLPAHATHTAAFKWTVKSHPAEHSVSSGREIREIPDAARSTNAESPEQQVAPGAGTDTSNASHRAECTVTPPRYLVRQMQAERNPAAWCSSQQYVRTHTHTHTHFNKCGRGHTHILVQAMHTHTCHTVCCYQVVIRVQIGENELHWVKRICNSSSLDVHEWDQLIILALRLNAAINKVFFNQAVHAPCNNIQSFKYKKNTVQWGVVAH